MLDFESIGDMHPGEPLLKDETFAPERSEFAERKPSDSVVDRHCESGPLDIEKI
jgi:hypothetical protein